MTSGFHRARRHRDRRRPEPHHGSRGSRAAGKAEEFERKGSVLVGDVHPLDVAARGRRLYAGAGRRGAADHRDADGEYRGLAERHENQSTHAPA